MKSFYSILGCNYENCSNSEIKHFYFTQLRKLHPDKNRVEGRSSKSESNVNVDEFVLINQAWFVLGFVLLL